MIVKFNLGNKREEGELVKDNEKTVLVLLKDGSTIKRHKVKHDVEEKEQNWDNTINEIIELRKKELTYEKISVIMNISIKAIGNICRKNKQKI